MHACLQLNVGGGGGGDLQKGVWAGRAEGGTALISMVLFVAR